MPKSGEGFLFFFLVCWVILCVCVCVERSCCDVCRCGYATLHHVVDKSKEDRMESFFLSETCKYLYLVNQIRCFLVKELQLF